MENAPKTTWAAGSDERATLVGRKRLEGGKGSAVAERDAHSSEIEKRAVVAIFQWVQKNVRSPIFKAPLLLV